MGEGGFPALKSQRCDSRCAMRALVLCSPGRERIDDRIDNGETSVKPLCTRPCAQSGGYSPSGLAPGFCPTVKLTEKEEKRRECQRSERQKEAQDRREA